MHTRPLHPPVHRRHVRIMLGVLALVTWLLIAPIAYLDALGFWNSTEPVFIAAFVTALPPSGLLRRMRLAVQAE